MNNKEWYNLTLAGVAEKLKVGKSGVSSEEAVSRLSKYGYNELPKEPSTSTAVLFLRQFASSLVYILIAASAISFYLGERIDAGVILAAVFANVIVGFFQEYKAQKALMALKQIITPQCWVVRDNKERFILARDLVPGDIVVLNSGAKVPADGRIFEEEYLKINESSLTGESEPVDKINRALEGALILPDQHNMVFMGTIVTEGRGKFFVTATGINTEIGKIAGLVRSTKSVRTPLQIKLDRFSRDIGLIVLGLVGLLFLVGIYLDYSFIQMFNTSVAIAVAAIPEGLAVAVTVILALGMRRILKQGSLVRKLVATETLGSTSVICVDKTGTITLGEMRVVRLVSASHDIDTIANGHNLALVQKGLWELRLLHRLGLFCNNAVLASAESKETTHKETLLSELVAGSPTEKAILLSALDSGFSSKDALHERPRFDEIQFSSEKKFMATLNQWTDKQNIIYFKGAPEKILSFSDKYLVGRKQCALDAKKRNAFIKQYEKLSQAGLRVLAGAYKPVNKETTSFDELMDYNQGAVFVGFWGIKDPIRPEVKASLLETKSAGIRTIMITGDNKHTAASIAREAGLDPSDGKILEGKELVAMSDAQLACAIKKAEVFARVTPQDKLRIVEALQADGEVVAMTGDGVNDAPALARSDIGLAFGSGTDVAKETADIVLLDNNFSTIVAAVRQGRVIFDNIKKVVLYLLSDAFSEMMIITVGVLAGGPLAILPAQILWINLVTDSLPHLALTQEKEEPETMSEPPRPKRASLLDFEQKFLIFFITIITATVTLGLFYIMLGATGDLARARTIAFTTLAIDSLLYVFSARTVRHTIFETYVFSNKWLLAAAGGGIIIQLLGIYTPFLQKILRTVPLGIADWILILLAVAWVIIAIEIAKYFFILHRREPQRARS